MMLTTRFLYYFYLYIVIYATLGEATDVIAKEIRLLNQIDNAQVVQGLIMNVDQVLNDYIRDQMSVESNKVRAIIWNQLPSNNTLKYYFDQNFKVIKYDDTYQDFPMKNFDYTRHDTLLEGRTWEKFIFVRVQNEIITLFFSYTMKLNIDSSTSSNIGKFFSDTSVRMFNKLFHPVKSVYSHGMILVNNKTAVQYFLVHHDNRDGYIERIIPSFEDGIKQQEEIDKRKLSSCILIINDGQKSLHSIRHPIIRGYIVPDFHAHYGIKCHSTIHYDL
jgi:hypothetical protein